MTAELSYLQLKAANDAREAEEVRSEQRRRNVLVLILQHLRDEGYLDSAEVLLRETGSASLAKYQVCDNIDLPTILQEYESYYFVKFKKNPKITKKVALNSTDSKSKRSCKSTLLPPIPPHYHSETATVRDEKQRRSSSGDRKKNRRKANAGDSKSLPCVVSGSPTEELGLTGSAITETTKHKTQVNVKGLLKQAIADASSEIPDPTERLLKPIAGFAGYSSEMRELASVISRDIYHHNPNVHWDDIIGLDAAKRLVKEAVVYPIKYPQLFTGILAPWKGLLLYGPPGTGKTMLAKAVATECKTTFFNISASSIVSKWRGDSEKLVRVLFELARFHAPSTIFMDELESIMGQRGGGMPGTEHEGSRRMKTELLVQMDGLAKSEDLVFVLAASNLPWELDYGMLRRLEKRILVDLPVKSARSAMFAHHLPATISQHPFSITTDIDYDQAAQLTEGYSGSDIRLVCKEAVMRSVRKVFNRLDSLCNKALNHDGLEDVAIDPVTTKDIQETVSKTKPSARQLTHKYTEWQKEYESV